MQQKWPSTLWIVRHGQSAGNVAREQAESAGLSLIDIAERDVDVPLSKLGVAQAQALGRWFGALPAVERPGVVLCSPYRRARHTAQLLLEHAAPARGGNAARDLGDEREDGGEEPPSLIVDERLREKEFGVLDRLTNLGIRQHHPELAEQRRHVGKFYFRPPGGESWCDVILRLRSLLDTLTREYRGERVLIVSHQVVVNCLRYLLERLDEAEVLAIDRRADVPNCGVTSYAFDPALGRHGKLALRLVNFVSPLREAGTPVTAEPDLPAAPRS